MAYPMNPPFPTGLTIAIVDFVIFTIVVMASIQALIGSNVDALTRDASGGYDILGITSPRTPLLDFDARLETTSVAGRLDFHDGLLFARPRLTPPGGDPVFYEAYGIDARFAYQNGFTTHVRSARFLTDRDVWLVVLGNPNVTVVGRKGKPAGVGPPP